MSDQTTYAEELKSESDRLLAMWDEQDKLRRRRKADLLAERNLRDRQRQQDRQDRGFCNREAVRLGLRTVGSVWTGAPCDPALVFNEDSRYLIDDRGVHVIDATGGAVFVHGPCVEIGPRTFAVQTGGKWKTVALIAPPNRTAHKLSHDLEELARNGLAVGHGDVLLERGPDGERRANVATLALERILRAGANGEIVCREPVIRSLWDFQPDGHANLRRS